jgi:hypothetical protein
MNELYMVVKCERCGSECRLMYNSIRSNTILCPVCMENEIDCCLFSMDIQGCPETDDIMYNSYLYVTDSVSLSTN